MASSAQVERILSEVNQLGTHEKIILFHKIEELADNFEAEDHEGISLESAFGLWKDRTITKEDLRKKAWSKN